MDLFKYLLTNRIVFIAGYVNDKVRARFACACSTVASPQKASLHLLRAIHPSPLPPQSHRHGRMELGRGVCMQMGDGTWGAITSHCPLPAVDLRVRFSARMAFCSAGRRWRPRLWARS